jgi:hypothetical protein
MVIFALAILSPLSIFFENFRLPDGYLQPLASRSWCDRNSLNLMSFAIDMKTNIGFDCAIGTYDIWYAVEFSDV